MASDPYKSVADIHNIEHIETSESKRVTTIDSSGVEVNPIRKDLEGVGDLSVGITQVEIVISGTPQNIRIRADTSNTGIIFIGKTGILSDGTNDFVRLESGDEMIISYDDSTNALYAISDTASQKINIGALL